MSDLTALSFSDLSRRTEHLKTGLSLGSNSQSDEEVPADVANGHGDQSSASASAADILAKKLYEEEKRKREERKRKREAEEQWLQLIRKRIEEERKRLEEEERISHQANRELYQLFNDLQGISHDFNISFDVPELVVVGMQSDGKSTFIEGLLGFQFNIVDTNLGTRRPLIIQMMNNPACSEPVCRFRKESIAAAEEDAFEAEPTPVPRLSAELVRRTNQVAGKGDQVSAQPIILRVEYAHCPNLTIFDTPGFRLGGDERLRRDILEMVRKVMEPRNRIIICLEQSTVEWANTTSRPIVREIDRDFSRTVLVNTKKQFDNRVKELRDAASAAKYLEGEGLPPGKRAFFISMPLRRNLDPEQFSRQIKAAYLDDLERLLELRVDERYLPQIGFPRLRQHLERLLQERYQAAVAPTLGALEGVCRRTEAELAQVRRELQSNSLEALKARVLAYVSRFAALTERLLQGSIIGQPDRHGQTYREELEACGVGPWPAAHPAEAAALDLLLARLPNAELRLYGGAQYERLLHEFEHVAHAREFPPTSIHEVASALGTCKSHNIPLLEAAASDIVQIKARQTLAPLLDVILRRVTYVMRRLFDIVTQILRDEAAAAAQMARTSAHEDLGMIGVYEQFLAELRRVFYAFLERVEQECRAKLRDDFDTFTAIIDWDLLGGFSELHEYDYLNVQPADTAARVQRILQPRPATPAAVTSSAPVTTVASVLHVLHPRRVDEAVHAQVCTMAARLFSGIRFFFVKFVRNKLNAFFLDPMFQRLAQELAAHFRRLDDRCYEEIFQLGITELRERLQRLELQYQHCVTNRDRFKELLAKMKRAGAKFH